MENKKFEIERRNIMENKKFKLNKENLDVVSLMQHMVYINISAYREMKHKNFNDEIVQKDFELLCDRYIRLHESYSIHEWQCCYSDLTLPKMNKYVIQPDLTMAVYHLIIDLEKDYNNCSKVGIQVFDRMEEPVSINIFNVQFE